MHCECHSATMIEHVFQALKPLCSFSIQFLSHLLSSKSNLFFPPFLLIRTNIHLTLVAMLKGFSFRSQCPTLQMLQNQTVGWPHLFSTSFIHLVASFFLTFCNSWHAFCSTHQLCFNPPASAFVCQSVPRSHALSDIANVCLCWYRRRGTLTVCKSVSYT